MLRCGKCARFVRFTFVSVCARCAASSQAFCPHSIAESSAFLFFSRRSHLSVAARSLFALRICCGCLGRSTHWQKGKVEQKRLVRFTLRNCFAPIQWAHTLTSPPSSSPSLGLDAFRCTLSSSPSFPSLFLVIAVRFPLIRSLFPSSCPAILLDSLPFHSCFFHRKFRPFFFRWHLFSFRFCSFRFIDGRLRPFERFSVSFTVNCGHNFKHSRHHICMPKNFAKRYKAIMRGLLLLMV